MLWAIDKLLENSLRTATIKQNSKVLVCQWFSALEIFRPKGQTTLLILQVFSCAKENQKTKLKSVWWGRKAGAFSQMFVRCMKLQTVSKPSASRKCWWKYDLIPFLHLNLYRWDENVSVARFNFVGEKREKFSVKTRKIYAQTVIPTREIFEKRLIIKHWNKNFSASVRSLQTPPHKKFHNRIRFIIY